MFLCSEVVAVNFSIVDVAESFCFIKKKKQWKNTFKKNFEASWLISENITPKTKVTERPLFGPKMFKMVEEKFRKFLKKTFSKKEKCCPGIQIRKKFIGI